MTPQTKESETDTRQTIYEDIDALCGILRTIRDRTSRCVDTDPKDDGALYMELLGIDTMAEEAERMSAALRARTEDVRRVIAALGLKEE